VRARRARRLAGDAHPGKDSEPRPASSFVARSGVQGVVSLPPSTRQVAGLRNGRSAANGLVDDLARPDEEDDPPRAGGSI